MPIGWKVAHFFVRDCLQMFAYICLALAQFCVSISIVISKALMLKNSVWLVLQFRFLFATLFLIVLAMYSKPGPYLSKFLQWSRADQGFFIFQALCAAMFFNLLLFYGLKFTTASSAGIVTSFLPSMIILFSRIFLRESISLHKFFALILATIGLLLVNLHGLHSQHNLLQWLGDLLVFASLFPEATFYVMLKKRQFELPPIWSATLINLINAVLFVPLFLIVSVSTGIYWPSISDWVSIIAVSLATGMFYLLWYLGANYIEASVASLFTAVVPIGTLALAVVFLHEPISIFQITGMILVIYAIFVSAAPSNRAIKAF